MKAEHINPFIEETKNIFNEVAQINISPYKTSVKNTPITTKNVVVMIGVTGTLKGTVAVNLDEQFARKIASNMMCGMPVSELDEISMSAVKELFNMIMGRVATAFSEQSESIDITPPNMLIGEKIKLSIAFTPLLSIKFKYNEYDMDFDIAIR